MHALQQHTAAVQQCSNNASNMYSSYTSMRAHTHMTASPSRVAHPSFPCWSRSSVQCNMCQKPMTSHAQASQAHQLDIGRNAPNLPSAGARHAFPAMHPVERMILRLWTTTCGLVARLFVGTKTICVFHLCLAVLPTTPIIRFHAAAHPPRRCPQGLQQAPSFQEGTSSYLLLTTREKTLPP
jgi:hypothetical protein